jgi:hypothetical protein
MKYISMMTRHPSFSRTSSDALDPVVKACSRRVPIDRSLTALVGQEKGFHVLSSLSLSSLTLSGSYSFDLCMVVEIVGPREAIPKRYQFLGSGWAISEPGCPGWPAARFPSRMSDHSKTAPFRRVRPRMCSFRNIAWFSAVPYIYPRTSSSAYSQFSALRCRDSSPGAAGMLQSSSNTMVSIPAPCKRRIRRLQRSLAHVHCPGMLDVGLTARIGEVAVTALSYSIDCHK